MDDLASVDMAAALGKRLRAGGKTWLFLDYDGTLSEFAPTPEFVIPDTELIHLIQRLSRHQESLRVVILSGRKTSQIQELIPVPGVLLAGAYGLEYLTWDGETVHLMDVKSIQPYLEQVKKIWREMIDGRPGFYLEDKGYTVALHAKNAQPEEALNLLQKAEQSVRSIESHGTAFCILGGWMFLEAAPVNANKGESLRLLLDRFPWPGAEIFYVGDDDKDEAAFEVVRQLQGTPMVVAALPHPTHAVIRFPSTAHVRGWLSALADVLEQE